jgi:hypothetical protein
MFASKLEDMNAIRLETVKNNLWVNLFQQEQPKVDSFSMTTKVIGLSLFQMPMIYHHLHSGVELNLHYNYGAQNSQQAVEIFYKHFKLGYLPFPKATLVEKMLMHGFDLKVRIDDIIKRKYMPISELVISINENYL